MPAVPALTITARDAGSRARAGILRTAHGDVRTPAFVPLATKATVKGMLPAEVAALGYDIVLGNTFHLFLDPGHERIARFGGLHEFMGWSGPIVTDSGGFQVFSMGHGTVADEIKGRTPHGGKRQGGIIAIEERGVRFRSYLDGSERFMAPETSMEIQAALGLRPRARLRRVHAAQRAARLHRALDRAHAPLAAPLPGLAPRARPRRPARVRHRPGRRLRGPARSSPPRPSRPASATGIAIGGSLGADKAEMHAVVDWTTAALAGGPSAPPAGHRRDRRPRARRRAGHRHLRLRDADAPGPPRHGARARPRGPLARRPQPGALEGLRRAADGGLPVPGVRAGPHARLPALPGPRARAHRHAPVHAAQPRVRRARRAPPARGDRRGHAGRRRPRRCAQARRHSGSASRLPACCR